MRMWWACAETHFFTVRPAHNPLPKLQHLPTHSHTMPARPGSAHPPTFILVFSSLLARCAASRARLACTPKGEWPRGARTHLSHSCRHNAAAWGAPTAAHTCCQASCLASCPQRGTHGKPPHRSPPLLPPASPSAPPSAPAPPGSRCWGPAQSSRAAREGVGVRRQGGCGAQGSYGAP